MVKILIDRGQFQSEILNIIADEKFKDVLACMTKQSDDFKQGFIQGLCWASLLTSQLHEYVLRVDD